jgi:hypothetical protein
MTLGLSVAMGRNNDEYARKNKKHGHYHGKKRRIKRYQNAADNQNNTQEHIISPFGKNNGYYENTLYGG